VMYASGVLQPGSTATDHSTEQVMGDLWTVTWKVIEGFCPGLTEQFLSALNKNQHQKEVPSNTTP